MNIGDTKRFTVTAYTASGQIVESEDPAWSSSNALVASVNSDGIVRARKNGGPVTITAKVRINDGRSILIGTATVYVGPRPVGWVSVPSPTTQPLNAIWGASPKDIWAAGEFGTMLHYDGTSWTSVPNAIGGRTITRLYGFASNDIWGSAYTPGGSGFALYHYEGAQWSYVPRGLNGALWGAAPNDVWFTGEPGVVMHYDGVNFTGVSNPGINAFYQVTGVASNDVWFFGHQGPTIAHWNGSALTAVAAPVLDRLWAGWAVSTNNVWATGSADATGQNAITVHWDGTAWSTVTVPAFVGPGIMQGMWAAGANAVWMVGARGQIVQFDGAQWLAQPTPTTSDLVGAWGFSPTDVWVVGTGGAILHRTFLP